MKRRGFNWDRSKTDGLYSLVGGYHRLVKALALPLPSPSLFSTRSGKERIKLNDICSREMSPRPSRYVYGWIRLYMYNLYQKPHFHKHVTFPCWINFVILMPLTFGKISIQIFIWFGAQLPFRSCSFKALEILRQAPLCLPSFLFRPAPKSA